MSITRKATTTLLLLAGALAGSMGCDQDSGGDHATVGIAGAGGDGGTPTGAGGAAAGHDPGGAGSGAVGSSGGRGATGGSPGFGGAAGGPPVCNGPGARFVTDVISVQYGPGQDFGQDQMPEIVYGPPGGAGCCTGSTDVVSLGNGGQIVVAFAGNGIADGPGPDFVVFENAFFVGGDPLLVFAELATVEVSTDGVDWVEFPCTAVDAPYGDCAGWHPVMLDGDDGPIDVATAGGDAFDLADVGLSWARYVRITDRSDLEGPTGVFDLDAVGIVNASCP